MKYPFEDMYDFERWSTNLLIFISFLFFLGIFLIYVDLENPLSDFLSTYFLDQIINEGTSGTGDSDYNLVNTFTYAFVLMLFVIFLSSWLRQLNVDTSEATILALLPFISWAVFGQVLEDANMFNSSISPFFVSPGVHFHTATWVIIGGYAGYLYQRNNEGENHSFNSMCSLLILIQFIIFFSSISESTAVLNYQIPLAPLVILGTLSVFLPQIFDNSLDDFTPIQKSAYLIGLGGTVIFLGALSAYVLHNPEDDLLLWPLIIIPISALVAIFMYVYGKDASFELNKNGLVAGVLPQGMTENEYLEFNSPDKDLIESLRWKAVMSYPIVFLAVSGQILDGLATFVGLEYLGYSEKHVVSERIIDWSRDNFDTAAAFILVKVGLGGLIWWFYTLANFEFKQQHLRLLVGLAMMVVGLAPGLRDILRMALGV
tara:strand:- start:4038 stop:5327 length:1290 start_codon:yes stop_codon:yes gene_type:complete